MYTNASRLQAALPMYDAHTCVNCGTDLSTSPYGILLIQDEKLLLNIASAPQTDNIRLKLAILLYTLCITLAENINRFLMPEKVAA